VAIFGTMLIESPITDSQQTDAAIEQRVGNFKWFTLLSCIREVIIGDQWADPSGTAMLGQPVTKPEQAPELHPLTKISLISKGAHGPRIRY
jgi:hypothetical protein